MPGPHRAVLAVVVARIGDTLLVTPALRALKQSSGRLTVLAHPKRLEVLRNLSFIDELGGITKNTAWLKALISSRYDLAVCYGREPALFRYCARTADHVIAFDSPELRGLFGKAVTRVPVPPESSTMLSEVLCPEGTSISSRITGHTPASASRSV